MTRFGLVGSVIAAALVARPAHAEPTKEECVAANESGQAARAALKLRDAIQRLSVCVAPSCPDLVRDDCARRLSDAQRALPMLRFEVHGSAGLEPAAVQVKVDNAVLASKLDGGPLTLDPGLHTFQFEADGFRPLELQLLVNEGVQDRMERVVMRDATSPPPPERDASARSTSATRLAAFTALGVGVAGLAVGSVAGVLAIRDKAALGDHCRGNVCPTSEQSDIDGFGSSGAVSTAGFTAGIVALAGATVLFLVSRSPDGSSPSDVPRARLSFGPAGFEGVFR